MKNLLNKRRKQKKNKIKILTPDQMLSRLPVSLAQSKAGNNSEKKLMNSDSSYILCTLQVKKNL